MIDAAFHQSDVNHITGDIHYVGLLLAKRRTVVTVHDCHHLLRSLHGWRRRLYYLLWFSLPLRRAAAITTVSEATKGDLVRLLHCDPRRIRVIPNPVSDDFVAAPAAFNAEHPAFSR